jgi:hypothetical protein
MAGVFSSVLVVELESLALAFSLRMEWAAPKALAVATDLFRKSRLGIDESGRCEPLIVGSFEYER